MAAGRPMILSDIPVFREITRNQGTYFQYDDIEQIAGMIEQVLASVGDQDRQIEFGRQRVDDFSFKLLAHQLKNLYESLN